MERSAKQLAIKLLARREHSEAEIRQKLHTRDYSPGEIAEAVEQLQQGGWLSDERFTEAYIRGRRLKGFGPVRIASELRERGVEKTIVRRYLKADDKIWLETLQNVYHRKYGDSHCEDYPEKARRMRFLQYRGFSIDSINEVVD